MFNLLVIAKRLIYHLH